MINDEGTGFFVAGIFPKQGAYFYSMDVRSGKILDQSQIEKSIQGYLEQRENGIFAATGRDPNGTTLAGKPMSNTKSTRTNVDTPTYSRITDAVHEYLGRQNRIVARSSGAEEAWTATIDGNVYDLAIANGQLFASSDSGPPLRVWGNSSTPKSNSPKQDPRSQTSTSGYALFIAPRTEDQLASLLDCSNKFDMRIVGCSPRRITSRDTSQ